MKFDIINLLMNPFVLMFFAIATGLLFGKIKFGKFNFGTSGSLFTGLLIGWLIYRFGMNIIESGPDSAGYSGAVNMMNNEIINSSFLETSLIFFVATIGLLAAKDMGAVLRKYGAKFVVLGMVITLLGAAATYGAMILIDDTNSYEVSGVYVGALTSSPGLGAALETAENQAREYAESYEQESKQVQAAILKVIDPSGSLTPENTPVLSEAQKATYIINAPAGVGVGYAIAYPFGVIIVIFAVNFFASIFRMDVAVEKRRYEEEMRQAREKMGAKDIPTTPFNIISFSIVCVIGYLVGSIQVWLGPLGYFSLGATGGILIMGLFLGYIGKIGPLSFRMDPKALAVIREIGLVFFLAIVGLKYGHLALDAILGSGIILAISAIVIGVLAMLAGFILGRFVFKLNWVMLSGAICGGMTSTPGLGAACEALDSDDPAAGYGATYPFALLGMIIFTIILNKLPIM